MSWFDRVIQPMLARPSKPFSSPNFIYELKFDGTRCISFIDVERNQIRMQNRRLMEISYRYPEIDLPSAFGKSVVVDGEIVVLKGGKPDFSLLQKREHVESRTKISLLSKLYPATYMVFDILYINGDGWIMDRALKERKEALEEVISETPHVLKVEWIKSKGGEFYEKVVALGMEGIMAKKLGSVYQPGRRSEDWLKIKKSDTVDCVIAGYLEGEGWRTGYFGSLILALYDGNTLVHVGQVGTGFDSEFVRQFGEKLKEIEVDQPYFDTEFKRKVHWVKPVYVCEVEYLETTKDGKLRAPVFRRLRSDKSPEECTVDQIIDRID
jgi:bifunctional non-homologous end joining protein LigD